MTESAIIRPVSFAVILTVLSTSVCLSGCERIGPDRDTYEKFGKVKVGMSEAQVRDMLGEPYKEYTRENAPQDYYVEGWEYEQRQIKKKVLIFIEGSPICYVYFDASGKVEHTFVGGS